MARTGPDFRANVSTYRDGFTGEMRTATFVGVCVNCGIRTFSDTGGNDPRGPLGDHAAAPFYPADYSAQGEIVPACFRCQNDTRERYLQALSLAETAGRWVYPAKD